MSHQPPGIKLLWTGGWDSTYRLLDTLLVRGKSVQPYYLTDPGRPSTAYERTAMDRIAAAVARRNPDAAARLAPPIVTGVAHLRPDAEITARFERLRGRSHLGGQYDWLARFALQHGLDDLELSIHRDDRAAEFLQRHVVREGVETGDPYYRLRTPPTDDDLRIFERFRFPLFDLTKREMERGARRSGFIDLMELTWFCHVPTPDGRPCGRCNPCRYTIAEGLARRIPLQTRLRNHRVIQAIKRPLRAAAARAGLVAKSPRGADTRAG
jgi:hypothetical protein